MRRVKAVEVAVVVKVRSVLAGQAAMAMLRLERQARTLPPTRARARVEVVAVPSAMVVRPVAMVVSDRFRTRTVPDRYQEVSP